MEKNNIKRIVSKVIANTGMKSAKIEASQACVMFIYQPKCHKLLIKTEDKNCVGNKNLKQ